MPSVVIDTSVALPATLSPHGMTRKFWLLLAIGALTHRAEHLRLERDALQAEAEHTGGGETHGADLLERLAVAADQRLVAMRERLPTEMPQDWVALGSAVLFDEYERKVADIGPRLNPTVTPEQAPVLRRQFEAICIGGPPPFEPATAPALTRDPGDDPIVYTALLADVDFLISDDRDIVPDGNERSYEHGEHRTLAVRFGHFLREHFQPSELDWGSIDGTMLATSLVERTGGRQSGLVSPAIDVQRAMQPADGRSRRRPMRLAAAPLAVVSRPTARSGSGSCPKCLSPSRSGASCDRPASRSSWTRTTAHKCGKPCAQPPRCGAEHTAR
jgi:predicted nucleic acid-binding protein